MSSIGCEVAGLGQLHEQRFDVDSDATRLGVVEGRQVGGNLGDCSGHVEKSPDRRPGPGEADARAIGPSNGNEPRGTPD